MDECLFVYDIDGYLKAHPALNAQLADICLGTSAAPTFLPAHYFENEFEDGVKKEFNLIDGGVIATNPCMLAIHEATKEFQRQNKKESSTMLHNRLVVISLGTGSAQNEHKFNAKAAAKWGLVSWLIEHGSSPLITSFYEAGCDIDDTLTGTATTVDVGTEENLERLAIIAEDLLRKPVSRVDLESGRFVPIRNGGTNGEALKRFARLLSEERKLRLRNDYPQTTLPSTAI
ncbi:hypothetical protein V2J09_021388 [Rumex salicifolius]